MKKTRIMINKIMAGATAVMTVFASSAAMYSAAYANTGNGTGNGAAVYEITGDEFDEKAFEEYLKSLSLDELLEKYAQINSRSAPDYGDYKFTEIELQDPDYMKIAAQQNMANRRMVSQMFTNAVGTFFNIPFQNNPGTKSAPSGIITPAVSRCFDQLLGVKDLSTSNDDVIAAVDAQTKMLIEALNNAQDRIIDGVNDFTIESLVCTRVQGYNDEADAYSDSIRDIFINRNYVTDNDRTVATAALLGDLGSYNQKDIVKQMNIAYNCWMSNNRSIDPQNRTLFEIAYDQQVMNSMFKGEAIDRTRTFVTLRINNYLKSSLVLLEILRAQAEVDSMTPEEAAALSPAAAKLYKKIHENAYLANGYQAKIIHDLIDKDRGLLPAAQAYLTQKDRTLFINRTKTAADDIYLLPKIRVLCNKDFVLNPDGDDAGMSALTLNMGLILQKISPEQVRAILKHAGENCPVYDRNGNRVTAPNVRDYLEAVGFDLSEVRRSTAFFGFEIYDDFTGKWKAQTVRCGTVEGDMGIKGVSLYGNGSSLEKFDAIKCNTQGFGCFNATWKEAWRSSDKDVLFFVPGTP